MKTAGLLLLATLAGAGVLFLQNCGVSPVKDSSPPLAQSPSATSTSVVAPAVPSIEPEPDPEPVKQQTFSTAPADGANAVRLAEREAFYQRFDLTEIGFQPLSDGDFNELVAFLRDDPVLLARFLSEYRATTDPERARRLAQVLEEFDETAITTLAEDLVFSGNVSSQIAGLDLLGGQQKENPQAREIISQVLEMEANPEVLSSALNALAQPGKTTAEEKARLLNQFAMHAQNDDVGVRRRSVMLMQRWAGDENMNAQYITALRDPDLRVRSSAVLSLNASKHRDDSVYQSLVSVIENSAEDKQLRRNALLGLQKFGISDEEKQRFLDILVTN